MSGIGFEANPIGRRWAGLWGSGHKLVVEAEVRSGEVRVGRCQGLPPQQPRLGWLTGIGEPVDGAQGAAHLLVEAAGRNVDVLSLDLEPPEAAGAGQSSAARNSADPMPPPRSRGDTRMSHSTATSSRPPSM